MGELGRGREREPEARGKALTDNAIEEREKIVSERRVGGECNNRKTLPKRWRKRSYFRAGAEGSNWGNQ